MADASTPLARDASHSDARPADLPTIPTDPVERTFSYTPAGVGIYHCPYCGRRKRADRPSCKPCDDLPGLEPL